MSGRIKGTVNCAGESDVSLRCALVEGDGLTSDLCPVQFHMQGNEARNLAKQTTPLHFHESHTYTRQAHGAYAKVNPTEEKTMGNKVCVCVCVRE